MVPKFESFMLDHDFNKTQADHSVFVKKYDGGDFLILMLYVDCWADNLNRIRISVWMIAGLMYELEGC